RDMLSADLDWRQLDLAYKEAFPVYVDNIVAVVEAETPDQAADAARQLTTELQKDDSNYQQVFHFGSLEHIRNNALLYLDRDELADLADNLARIQPFLGQLLQEPNLRGLFALLEDALIAQQDGTDVDLAPLINEINAVLTASATDKTTYLSWQNLISGNVDERDVYREFIIIRPEIDFGSLLPGETAIQAVRTAVRDLDLQDRFAAEVRLTGGAALGYEELESVSQGSGIATIIALLIVAVILVFGLRSMRLVLASLSSLIAGLLLTAAIATLTVGELNMISVAFAVLYIGLGIDFAVHFCLRFREHHDVVNTNTLFATIEKSGVSVGGSLSLCALTTAVGFYAFMPTDYRGIAELGWISGTGMFISLLVTMTLLPALLATWPPRPIIDSADERRAASVKIPSAGWWIDLSLRHTKTVCTIAAILAIAAIWLIPHVRFDSNTLNLQASDNESVQTYRDLLADPDTSPWTGIVIADNETQAQQLAANMETLPEVNRVLTLQDFIPANQTDKLAIIDDINFLLLGGLELNNSASITNSGRLAAIDEFLQFLATLPPEQQTPELRQLNTGLERLFADAQQQPQLLVGIEDQLLQNLPGRIDELTASLNASEFGEEDLPSSLRERWLSPDGEYLLEILPTADLNDVAEMRKFVTAARDITPNLVGSPVIQTEAGAAVVAAFKQAFILALCVIALMLWVLLRNLRLTLIALIPLLLAAALTASATILLGTPFNFANIIALPLLLGIGIDNSIHILYRHRLASLNGNLPTLQNNTTRAIIISALTTMLSIGNLAFSPHQGTASMGLLLTVGIAISLACALILLPSLLILFDKQPVHVHTNEP
ncbi:MAG: MMPL family transporter, partial [Gammaproteobacteria bacterium]